MWSLASDFGDVKLINNILSLQKIESDMRLEENFPVVDTNLLPDSRGEVALYSYLSLITP